MRGYAPRRHAAVTPDTLPSSPAVSHMGFLSAKFEVDEDASAITIKLAGRRFGTGDNAPIGTDAVSDRETLPDGCAQSCIDGQAQRLARLLGRELAHLMADRFDTTLMPVQ